MAHLPSEIFNQYFLTFDRGRDLERLDDQDYYVWNKRLSAALWEILCDVEMALRFSIDRELGRLNVTESNQGSWIENVESLIGIEAFQICTEVLYAISPTIAQWSADNSRVLEVLAQKPM